MLDISLVLLLWAGSAWFRWLTSEECDAGGGAVGAPPWSGRRRRRRTCEERGAGGGAGGVGVVLLQPYPPLGEALQVGGHQPAENIGPSMPGTWGYARARHGTPGHPLGSPRHGAPGRPPAAGGGGGEVWPCSELLLPWASNTTSPPQVLQAPYLWRTAVL